MDTFILRGDSGENTNLLLRLAKKLNMRARKLSAEETEEIGLLFSIQEGISSGLLSDEEKIDFMKNLESK
jgi:hypothetical protein